MSFLRGLTPREKENSNLEKDNLLLCAKIFQIERPQRQHTTIHTNTVRQDRACDQKDHGKYRRYVTKEGCSPSSSKKRKDHTAFLDDPFVQWNGLIPEILSSSERFYNEKCAKVKFVNKISQTGSSSENGVHEFSRAPRFSWQNIQTHEKRPVDITHKSRMRNRGSSPSPCSYNVPTSFSPYTEEKRAEEEKRRRSETKNSSPSVSKKLNFTALVQKGPPPPGIEGDFEEQDEVSEFVKSSVKGKTFKMWESSSPSGEWKDKQGYSRSGRWVTVRSKEDRKQKSKRKGIAYMAKMQNTTFDQQNLSRLFDQIDVNGDKAVSGEELRNFLHEERDRPAGKALLKYMSRARGKHHGGKLFNTFDKIPDNHSQRSSSRHFFHRGERLDGSL